MTSHTAATEPIEQAAALRRAVERSGFAHRRRLWLAAGLEVAWRIALAAMAVIALDALWRLPASARALALIALIGWAGWLIWRYRPRRQHDRVLAEARRLEQGGQLTGNELINALTLGMSRSSMSPAPMGGAAGGGTGDANALAATLAMRSVERGRAAMGEVRFQRDAAKRLMRVAAMPLVIIVIFMAALGLAMPGLFDAGLWRLLAPWADHPPYSMTRLTVALVPAEVRKGESVEVHAGVGGRDVSQAHLVQLDQRGEEVQRWPMRDTGQKRDEAGRRHFVHQFSAVTDPVHYRIEAGTARTRHKTIEPKPLAPASLKIELADPPAEGYTAAPGGRVTVGVHITNEGQRSSDKRALAAKVTDSRDTPSDSISAETWAAESTAPPVSGGNRATVRLNLEAPEEPGSFWVHIGLSDQAGQVGSTWAEPARLRVEAAGQDAAQQSSRDMLEAARTGTAELQRLQDQLERLIERARELQQRLADRDNGEEPGAQSPLSDIEQERLDDLTSRIDDTLADAESLKGQLQQAAQDAGGEPGELAELSEAMDEAAAMLAELGLQDAAANRPGEAAGVPEQGQGHGGVSDAGRTAEWTGQLRDAAEADRQRIAASQFQRDEAMEGLARLMQRSDGDDEQDSADLDPQGQAAFDQTIRGDRRDEAAAAAEGIPHRHRDIVHAYMSRLERLLQED